MQVANITLYNFSGHHFYEGIFSYDIQFILHFILVKEKLLTIDEFNLRLKEFRWSKREKGNKPCPFKIRKAGSKYEGSAGQLRVLLKVVVLLLSDVIEKSEVGRLIISLQEVSEYVVAPRLTIHEIRWQMAEAVTTYLDLRINAITAYGMSPVRPKHHYLRYGSI